jgi:hypothetical protein
MTTIARGLAAALACAAFAAACGGNSDSPTTPTAPSTPSSRSHNAGRNCLDCHNFAAAGTVYHVDGSAYVGAVVRLTSGLAGTGSVVATVTTDGAGNFYTSSVAGLASGLYTDAAGPGQTPRAMQTQVRSGACNSCHAGSSRIVAD